MGTLSGRSWLFWPSLLVAAIAVAVAFVGCTGGSPQCVPSAQDPCWLDDDPAIGPEDAPVLVVEFCDYRSQYCADFNSTTLPHLLETGQVRVVFRDLPVLGPASELAAQASECAHEQDRFWDYHNLLFERMGSWDTLDDLVQMAGDVGLDTEAFRACLESGRYADEVRDDAAFAESMGLDTVPSWLVGPCGGCWRDLTSRFPEVYIHLRNFQIALTEAPTLQPAPGTPIAGQLLTPGPGTPAPGPSASPSGLGTATPGPGTQIPGAVQFPTPFHQEPLDLSEGLPPDTPLAGLGNCPAFPSMFAILSILLEITYCVLSWRRRKTSWCWDRGKHLLCRIVRLLLLLSIPFAAWKLGVIALALCAGLGPTFLLPLLSSLHTWIQLLLPVVLYLLALVLCGLRAKLPEAGSQPTAGYVEAEISSGPPLNVEPFLEEEIEALWEPRPALVIGLGRTGRWVLTYLKKNLLDASLGKPPDNVCMMLIDTGDYELLASQEAPVEFCDVRLDPDSEIILELKDNLQGRLEEEGGLNKLDEFPWFRKWWAEAARPLMEANALDLRQGARGRPVARAALIYNLREWRRCDSTEESIWERLLDAAKRCRNEDGRLDIMLVGSLADDVGGGMLFDMAYIARKVAEAICAEGSLISAYLATDRPIAKGTMVPERLAVNAAATVRELKRFQLADGRPYQVRYGNWLDGVCDWLPIDELYLYDGEREAFPLTEQRPEIGIYPAMADIISIHLDKQSQRGEIRWRHNELIKGAIDQQRARDKAIFNSHGVYQYRLAFPDILEYLSARYARELVQRLLNGEGKGEEFKFEWSLSNEKFGGKRNPQELAGYFVEGKWEIEGVPDLPPGWDEVLRCGVADDDEGVAAALDRIEAWTADVAIEQFRQRLSGVVELLMNGQSGTRLVIARSAKIGLTLDFLREVGKLLGKIEVVVDRLAGDDEMELKDTVTATLKQFVEITATMQRSLERQRDMLYSGADDVERPLFGRLAKLERKLERVKETTQDFATRKYVWQDAHGKDLAYKWYVDYLLPHVEEGLRCLYWQVSESGEVALTLHIGGRVIVLDSPEAIAGIEQALIGLGRTYSVAVRRHENLAGVLRETILSRDHLGAATEQLLQSSGVLAKFDPTLAQELKGDVLLIAHPSVTEAEIVERAMRERVDAPRHILRYESTDPFTFGVLRRVYGVPVDALESLDSAWSRYKIEYGIAGAGPVGRAPTAVYEAEAVAIGYESRMREAMRRSPHILHHVAVMGLSNSERARAYLLALASGDVGVRRGEAVWLNVCGYRLEVVTGRRLGEDYLPEFVIGLLEYVRGDDSTEKILLEQYKHVNGDRFEQWSAWINNGYAKWLEGVREDAKEPAKDVLLLARMMVREWMERYGNKP